MDLLLGTDVMLGPVGRRRVKRLLCYVVSMFAINL